MKLYKGYKFSPEHVREIIWSVSIKFRKKMIDIHEQNAKKLLLPLKNPPQYGTLWQLYRYIIHTLINTYHLFYNKLIHLANKCSEITNSPFFSVERIRVVFKVNKWICFCIQNFNRNKAPQFKSQRCHDKHKRSRIKNLSNSPSYQKHQHVKQLFQHQLI